jgi:AcrR family transcriptional regulator
VIPAVDEKINIHTKCMKVERKSQAERRAATRAVLMATARRLFAAHGFNGVSNDKIVQEAGVTRGALYHHFADKIALFSEIFEEIKAEIPVRIESSLSVLGPMDPIAKVREAVNTWLNICQEPEVYRITIIDAPAVLGLSRCNEVSNRYGMVLARMLLESAAESGRIRDLPHEPLAQVMLGALRECATYLASQGNSAQARREVGDVINHLINSIGKP